MKSKLFLYNICLAVSLILIGSKFNVKCTVLQPVKFIQVPLAQFEKDERKVQQSDSCPRNVLCSHRTNVFESVSVQPSAWTKGQPVQIRFRTAKLFDIWSDVLQREISLSLYLYRLKREPENVPVTLHKFEGIIAQGLLINWASAYIIEFVPPDWLAAGEYLISVNYKLQEDYSMDYAIQIAAKVRANIKEEHIHDLSISLESAPKKSNLSPLEADLEIPPELMASSEDSLQDVCRRCSTSKVSTSICDRYIRETWEDFAKANPKFPQPVLNPVDVSKICRYAELDTQIQKLEFKYLSLNYMTVQSEYVNFRKFIFQEEKNLNLRTGPFKVLWFHPFINLEELLTRNYRLRIDKVIKAFDAFYVNFSKMLKDIDTKYLTIDQIEEIVTNINSLPTTKEFKRWMAKIIKYKMIRSGLKLTFTFPVQTLKFATRSIHYPKSVANYFTANYKDPREFIKYIWEF
ncbi:hypothetical protein BKA69DRAFT_1173185 [Paraphysoderma sedebokerense]|nr:hypothetical protein BKA69DRAFT_1173185 [Paraphysoderma sedebokerense]